MGGTFDPVHLGHLIGAQTAVDKLNLERIFFVPAANPPHKLNRPITPAEDRINMLKKALEGNTRFSLLLDEIERSGRSYTIDTVRRFRERELKEGDELFFILGADNLVEVHTWKNWEELAREVNFIVLAREGFNQEDSGMNHRLDRVEVLWVRMPLIGISATEIRELVASGQSIRYLVPDAVADYIASQGLYQKRCC